MNLHTHASAIKGEKIVYRFLNGVKILISEHCTSRQTGIIFTTDSRINVVKGSTTWPCKTF